MVATAFARALGSVGPAAPSAMVGFTAPNPVRYTETVSPICAGFWAVTHEPSKWTAPGPRPFDDCVNTPGAVLEIHSVTALEGTMLLNTCTLAMLPTTPVS